MVTAIMEVETVQCEDRKQDTEHPPGTVSEGFREELSSQHTKGSSPGRSGGRRESTRGVQYVLRHERSHCIMGNVNGWSS